MLNLRNNFFYRAFGFTLLEVMFSISIIAIVVTVVFKMHLQTLSMDFESRFYKTAPLLAQAKLVEIKINNFKPESDSGLFEDTYPGYSWSFSIENVESKILGNIADDLKKIDIFIYFNEDEYVYKTRIFSFMQN